MSEHELWNELGNLYFLGGAYGQAVRAYRRSIQLEASFGRPYSNLALAYVQQGKFAEAVDLYRKSLERLSEDKDKAISWNRLGNVYRYLKDYPSALVAYRQADELDPESTEGREEPGWLSGTQAAEEAESDVRTRPAEARARPDIQDTALPSGMDEGRVAAEDLTASWALAELAPYQEDFSASPDASPLTVWGEPDFEDEDEEHYMPLELEMDVSDEQSDGEDARKWLQSVDDVPPDAADAYAERDETGWGEGAPGANTAEAPSTEPAAEHIPPALNEVDVQAEGPVRYPLVHVGGSGAETAGRYEFAADTEQETDVIVEVVERRAAEFVLAAEVDMSATAEGDGRLAEAQAAPLATSELPLASEDSAAAPEQDQDEFREIEAQVAKFMRVVQINPRNAHAWDTLGNLYKGNGRYAEAVLAYLQAISNDASKAQYHHHLGLVYACQGRMEDAIGAFQRVLEIDPNHSLAHATLGGYYRKLGLEELAQKHIGKAMKSIFDSENEYNRACLAAICGNTDEALELLRVALRNKQTYVNWILRDPDLDFIRQDPRFKQLISEYTR